MVFDLYSAHVTARFERLFHEKRSSDGAVSGSDTSFLGNVFHCFGPCIEERRNYTRRYSGGIIYQRCWIFIFLGRGCVVSISKLHIFPFLIFLGGIFVFCFWSISRFLSSLDSSFLFQLRLCRAAPICATSATVLIMRRQQPLCIPNNFLSTLTP